MHFRSWFSLYLCRNEKNSKCSSSTRLQYFPTWRFNSHFSSALALFFLSVELSETKLMSFVLTNASINFLTMSSFKNEKYSKTSKFSLAFFRIDLKIPLRESYVKRRKENQFPYNLQELPPPSNPLPDAIHLDLPAVLRRFPDILLQASNTLFYVP